MKGIYWRTLTFKKSVIYPIKVNYTSYNYTPYNSTWMCLERMLWEGNVSLYWKILEKSSWLGRDDLSDLENSKVMFTTSKFSQCRKLHIQKNLSKGMSRNYKMAIFSKDNKWWISAIVLEPMTPCPISKWNGHV